jgi:hypothetical protein
MSETLLIDGCGERVSAPLPRSGLIVDVEIFIARYPRLFHMAEANTWPSIRKRGLLSTTAALEHLEIVGPERARLESKHRPEKVTLGNGARQIVLRDQKPMEPERLRQALVDGTTVNDWYRLINGKVFFWAEESRLLRLLNARHYRDLTHDVITVDTASLVGKYEEEIRLSHMNSGNTLPVPHPRGIDLFKTIAAYPTSGRGSRPAKEVVEVVVNYSVPDIASHVIGLRQMRGETVIRNLKP